MRRAPEGEQFSFLSFLPSSESIKSMSPEELLQQLDALASRRRNKDRRPEWLRHLVQQVADLFEPLCDVARVGYDCRLDEQGWLVRMYLGTSEIIGGPRDGQIEHASFRLDITRLIPLFDAIDRLEWYSISNADPDSGDPGTRCLLTLTGRTPTEDRVQLELLAEPPRYAPSGLHITASGAVIP